MEGEEFRISAIELQRRSLCTRHPAGRHLVPVEVPVHPGLCRPPLGTALGSVAKGGAMSGWGGRDDRQSTAADTGTTASSAHINGHSPVRHRKTAGPPRCHAPAGRGGRAGSSTPSFRRTTRCGARCFRRPRLCSLARRVPDAAARRSCIFNAFVLYVRYPQKQLLQADGLGARSPRSEVFLKFIVALAAL